MICSIEDLAQLIFDMKNANPEAGEAEHEHHQRQQQQQQQQQ